MSGVVQFMRDLVSKGMSWEDASVFAERFEERVDLDGLRPQRTANAERQARYRERKAVTSNVTNNETRNATEDNAAPLPRPSSPQTPQQPTPTPPDVTTRARGGAAKPNGFARFWEAYPNKVSKVAAEKAYARALLKIAGPDPPAVLLAGVDRAKLSRQWVEGYIPHPTTWLNGGGWDDQPAEIIHITGRPANGSPDRPYRDAKFDARQDNLATLERGADLAARLHRQS